MESNDEDDLVDTTMELESPRPSPRPSPNRNRININRRGHNRTTVEDNNNVDRYDNDLNPRPNQRARHIDDNESKKLKPLDNNLLNKSIVTRLQPVLISKLSEESIDGENLNLNYIDAKMLRVIAPSPTSTSAYTYSSKMRQQKNTNHIHYSRLLLLKIYSAKSNTENSRLCYIMEARNTNTSLWDRNVELRDNGILTIGTYLRILAPKPITKMMSGDIPMIETQFPVIVMKPPSVNMDSIVIDYEIQGNNALAFFQNQSNSLSIVLHQKKLHVPVYFAIDREFMIGWDKEVADAIT